MSNAIVPPEWEGKRLDQFLPHTFPKESRTYFQRLINRGLVLLNGRAAKKGEKISAGDEIEVEFALTPTLSLEPEDIPLDVVYEDDWMLVVNKPTGLVVHPGVGNWSGTFVNALMHYCSELPADDLRPGIVHRLDKQTSGLLVAAKREAAQTALVTMFSERQIYKEYLAICCGDLTQQTVDAPIGRHPSDRKKYAIIEGARNAITHFEPLGMFGQLSVVKVILETGRTHQIRVHAQSIGTPVLGDTTYGFDSWNKKYNTTRQLLHAYKMEFDHPITGEKLTVVAPPPADIAKYYESTRPKS